MSIDENRLRHALRRHAEGSEPDQGSWGRIQERAASERRRQHRRRAGLASGAVAAVMLAVVATLSLVPDDGARVVETGPAAPSATSVPSPAPPPPPDPAPTPGGTSRPTVVPGVWPLHTTAEREAYLDAGETRYDDPVEVARSFAVEYLGMLDPVVGGPSDPGPEGTVEVIVRPRGEDGQPVGAMETVVHLDPDGAPWQVLFTTSSNIHLEGDTFRNQVASPLPITGRARAFEGTVVVDVRQAGMEAGEALGQEIVTASGGADFGPFSSQVSFDPPTSEGFGALVLFTESALDGSTLEATVVGLNFGTGSATPTATPPPTTTPDPGAREVTIFLLRGEELVPVTRQVATSGVLRAAVEQLLAGPTEAERAQGLSSMFTEATAGLLRSVTLDAGGTAVIEFADLRPAVPNASASTASTLLLEQLDETVFQFPTVQRVEYRIDGSCDAFWEWLQRSCQVVERPGG